MSISATLQSEADQAAKVCTSTNWCVIGVAGVTGAGKTTLAQSLLAALPTTSVYVSQDEYILPNEYPGHLKAPREVGGLNKESLQSINMTKMIPDIREMLSSDPATIPLSDCGMLLERGKLIGSALHNPRPPPIGCRNDSPGLAVLLLEGFLLFNHLEIPLICQLLYCLTLSREECLERKSKRGYTSNALNSPQYFDLCIWPSYQQHFSQMCDSVHGINFLDGVDPSLSISERVLKDVLQLLKSSK